MSEPLRQDPLRIFIVEDESLIVMMLREMLEEIGHHCVVVSSRLADALKSAQEATYDLAILDVNVKGETSYGVADLVAARGLPFVFATGYGLKGIETAYRSAPILQKPFDIRALRAAIDLAINLARARANAKTLSAPSEPAS